MQANDFWVVLRTGKDSCSAGTGFKADKVALFVVWVGTSINTAGSGVNMSGFGVERVDVVGFGVAGVDFLACWTG